MELTGACSPNTAPRRACEDAGKTAELLPVLDLTSRMATEMRPAKCQKEHIVLWYGDGGGAPPLMSFNATGFDIYLISKMQRFRCFFFITSFFQTGAHEQQSIAI